MKLSLHANHFGGFNPTPLPPKHNVPLSLSLIRHNTPTELLKLHLLKTIWRPF